MHGRDETCERKFVASWGCQTHRPRSTIAIVSAPFQRYPGTFPEDETWLNLTYFASRNSDALSTMGAPRTTLSRAHHLTPLIHQCPGKAYKARRRLFVLALPGVLDSFSLSLSLSLSLSFSLSFLPNELLFTFSIFFYHLFYRWFKFNFTCFM